MPSLNQRANQLQVLQLRLQGRTDEEIVEVTGFSESFVKRAPNEILKRQEAEDAEFYRLLQNERLTKMLSAWWDSGMEDVEAAGFVLKLLQEQNKLNGLYKNQPTNMQVSPGEFHARLQQYIEYEVEKRTRQKIESKALEIEAEVVYREGKL